MSQVGSVLSKPVKLKRITKEGLVAELKAVVVYGGEEKAPACGQLLRFFRKIAIWIKFRTFLELFERT